MNYLYCSSMCCKSCQNVHVWFSLLALVEGILPDHSRLATAQQATNTLKLVIWCYLLFVTRPISFGFRVCCSSRRSADARVPAARHSELRARAFAAQLGPAYAAEVHGSDVRGLSHQHQPQAQICTAHR